MPGALPSRRCRNFQAWFVAYICLLVGPEHLFAAYVEGARGTFTSQSVKLEIRSGIAFRGRSFLSSDPALLVAVTNARVHPDALADYYDRLRVVEKRVRDDETGVVYFEFRPDGSYRGLSYYFAPGNGCGFCTREVVSTVRLHDGRLSGNLKGSEKGRPFEVALDLPLMSDDHGAALPADGGPPGAAYLAYHAALVRGDRAKLKAGLSLDRQQTWVEAEKKDDLRRFIDTLAGEHPEKSVRIVRGFVKGNTAVLLVTGDSAAGALTGEVLLMKENGAWHVDDELMDIVAR